MICGRTALRVVLGVTAAVCVTLFANHAWAACPPDCSGQTLTRPNFSHQNLAHANFQNATIIGGMFVKAVLTNADFSGATFQTVPGSPAQTPDFTYADLTNAKFIGAKFQGPTYFTYATLTCADFSQTILNNGNVVFGEGPLTYTPPRNPTDCRTTFQGATMNCEFIVDWRAFDLTGADVTACLHKLSGRDFSGAVMAKVNLDNAVLDGANFNGADLGQALLNFASLQCLPPPGKCVDLSGAQLQGAKLNNANLSGASLYNAVLSKNVNNKIEDAAALNSAHLKNVNLALAQLSGVSFENANFYGTLAATAGGCATSGNEHSGFTQLCASAFKANMNSTNFHNAYLFGVDFTSATIEGVSFTNAVLVGAEFSDATISSSSGSGASTQFRGAYLQGAQFDNATQSNVDMTNAFVDFSGGGSVYIDLSTTHNQFACSPLSPCVPASGADVCVQAFYAGATTVKTDNTTMTCPDGSAGPCGKAEATSCRDVPQTAHWNSKFAIGTPVGEDTPPPGWYSNDATYTCAAPDAVICSGKGSGAATSTW